MKRRTLLQLAATAFASLGTRIGLAQTPPLFGDEDRLRAIADVVLPQALGADGRARVVEQFVAWVRAYRPGAETDHGYGFPRLRRTGASPADRYPQQLDALDAAASPATSFAAIAADQRARVLESAIAAARIERLPARPDGGHVATDLMAFYFDSIEANDLAYGALIGRDTCRGLPGSENRPAPLPGGVR